MGWKEWPYWAKCGIITAIIFLILYLLWSIYVFYFSQSYELRQIVFPILRVVSLLFFIPFLSVALVKWKEQPYWIKGGVIGVFAYFFIFILFSIMGEKAFGIAILLSFITSIPYTIVNFVISLIPRLIGITTPGSFISIISEGITLIIIGVLIGWIVGKIKSRNQ